MKYRLLFLLFFVVLNFNKIDAQSTSVKIINTNNNSTTFSFSDLKAMQQTTLNVEAEDGTPHNYSGVEIQMLLTKAGIVFNKESRRQTLDSYMLIKAADNYSIIYALTEIDTAFSTKKMILALMKDSNALPQNFGPLQIIATGEKKHARLIRQVMEIDVRKVND